MNLLEIIDNQLLNPEVPSVRPHMTLHPSAASIKTSDGTVHGGCLRKEYWRFHGRTPSNPETPMSLLKMDMGNAVHDKVVEVLTKARLVDAAECDIWIPDHHVHGRVDIIVADDANQNKVGVEVKSTWGFGATGTIKPKAGVIMPKMDHVLQSLVYLAFYKQYGMEKWIILYVTRDNAMKMQHTIELHNDGENIYPIVTPGIDGEQVPLPEFTVRGVFERYDECWNYITTEQLPPRDYTIQYSQPTLQEKAEAGELNRTDTTAVTAGRFVNKGDWNCGYCRYKDLCWDGIQGNELYSGMKTKDD